MGVFYCNPRGSEGYGQDFNDGNHRITPSYNDHRRGIKFFGYVDEGVAFCSPASPAPGGDLLGEIEKFLAR